MPTLTAEAREEVRDIVRQELIHTNPATREDLAKLEGRIMSGIEKNHRELLELIYQQSLEIKQQNVKLEHQNTKVEQQNVRIEQAIGEIHKSARQQMIWFVTTIIGAIGLTLLTIRLFFWGP